MVDVVLADETSLDLLVPVHLQQLPEVWYDAAAVLFAHPHHLPFVGGWVKTQKEAGDCSIATC